MTGLQLDPHLEREAHNQMLAAIEVAVNEASDAVRERGLEDPRSFIRQRLEVRGIHADADAPWLAQLARQAATGQVVVLGREFDPF